MERPESTAGSACATLAVLKIGHYIAHEEPKMPPGRLGATEAGRTGRFVREFLVGGACQSGHVKEIGKRPI